MIIKPQMNTKNSRSRVINLLSSYILNVTYLYHPYISAKAVGYNIKRIVCV